MTLQLAKEVCQQCGGSGWEPVVAGEQSGVRPCPCKQPARVNAYLDAAHIPPRYRLSSFTNFEATVPTLQSARAKATRFVSDFPAVDQGLMLMGDPGTGKTHLACAVLCAIIEKDHRGLFFDMKELLAAIQHSYNPQTNASELSILQPVFDAPILVLDDLGVARPTEWVLETMMMLVNHRYNYQRPTVFTTNYCDDEQTAIRRTDGTVESLTDRIGLRFRSRLHDMTQIIRIMPGTLDYREVLKNRR